MRKPHLYLLYAFAISFLCCPYLKTALGQADYIANVDRQPLEASI